jgi:hypothetical protein
MIEKCDELLIAMTKHTFADYRAIEDR